MNSYQDDPIAAEGDTSIEQDARCLESSYGDADLLGGIGGIESDEAPLASMTNTLPRPPTKPNVYIDNETICPVCNQPAPKGDKHHLHYGGICCYSCRAFFRRACQTTTNTQLPCQNSRSSSNRANILINPENTDTNTDANRRVQQMCHTTRCGMDVKTTRQCQKCRFKRCFEIGMDSTWVLTRDQKKVRFRKLIRKRRMKAAKNKQVQKGSKLDTNQMIDKKEHPTSFQRHLKTLVPQENTNNARITPRSSHLIPTSTITSAESLWHLKQKDLSEGENLSMYNSSIFENIPPLIDFRARLLQLQNYMEKIENVEYRNSVEEGGATRNGFVPVLAQNHHTLLPIPTSLVPGTNFTSSLNGPSENHFTTSPLIAKKYEPLEANSRGLIPEQCHNIERQVQHNEQFNEDPHSAVSGTLHHHRQPYKSKVSRKQDHSYSETSEERTSSNHALNYKDAPELFCQNIFPDSSKKGSENEISQYTKGSFLHGQHIIGEPIEQNHRHVCNYKCLLQGNHIQAKDLSYPNMKVCQPHSLLINTLTNSGPNITSHINKSQTNVDKAKNLLHSKVLGAPEEFCVAQPNPIKYIGDKDKVMQQNNPQLKSPYLEGAPTQKGLTIDDRRRPLEKDQHDPSDHPKAAGTVTQHKSFGDSSFHPKTSDDENTNVPKKTFDYTTKPSKTPEYLHSYPSKRYFSSLEDNSEDTYNSSVYKNKKFKNGYLKQHHREIENRQVNLAKIDQILEDFVPAMRTTNIPTTFVWQLIDLHKTGCTNRVNNGEKLGEPSKTQEKDDGSVDVKKKLNKTELLKYFTGLEESFVKFARSCILFKSLCEKDQVELLKRNSILFVTYLFARYFSSDVPLEQLGWLLKGCGLSMPIGFFNDNDLDQISPITFQEFNDIYHVIDPEEGGGILHSSYALGIENIKHTFKYPQYYNGLIALSLLFGNDASYDLIERDRIKRILQETKELAVTGYEDVKDVTINKLNQLISTLGTMSDVFRRQYHHYRPVVIKSMSEKTTNRVDLDCFEPDNRITTQLTAVDYIIRLGEDLNSDTSQPPPITGVYTQDEESYMRNLIKGFQNAYISVTSGLVLSTIVDASVGRISSSEIPPAFTKAAINLFLERFRRVMKLHPEFSIKLSDFNRSALWRSNYLVAVALNLAKIESAEDGKTQFMYAIGQLTEEYDLFWDQEFNGYHGLKSMEAITRISMNGMCGQKLTQTELQHYYTLMSRVCPIVKDEICFQLLSMVIMFDTTAMSEDDSISFYWDDNSNQSLNSLETAGSTSSSGGRNSPGLSISDVNTNNAGSGNMAHNESVPEPNTTRHNGFGEIKVLQRHYIYLLRRRCMLLKGPLSRRLGDPDGMKNIMNSFKLLAQYVPALM